MFEGGLRSQARRRRATRMASLMVQVEEAKENHVESGSQFAGSECVTGVVLMRLRPDNARAIQKQLHAQYQFDYSETPQ